MYVDSIYVHHLEWSTKWCVVKCRLRTKVEKSATIEKIVSFFASELLGNIQGLSLKKKRYAERTLSEIK